MSAPGVWDADMATNVLSLLKNYMPVVCANSSLEGLSKFEYGIGSDVMTGVYHPATGFGKYVSSTSPERNLNLAFDLARRGGLDISKYLGSTDPDYKSYHPCRSNETVFPFARKQRVPYDIEFASHYKFNASRCGYFGAEKNRWRWVPDPCADVCSDVTSFLCSPTCTQQNTLCHPAGLLTLEDGGWGSAMRATGQQRKYWDPATICPDWRRMCGAQYPPNLPAELRKIELDRDHVWMHIPKQQQSGYFPPWLWKVRDGQLPDANDRDLEWQIVHIDSPICKARDLHEARYMQIESQPTDTQPASDTGATSPVLPLASGATCNPAQFKRVSPPSHKKLDQPSFIGVFRWDDKNTLYYNGERVPASYAHTRPDCELDDPELWPVANNLRFFYNRIKPKNRTPKSRTNSHRTY